MRNTLIPILLTAVIICGCRHSAKVSEPAGKYSRKPITEVSETQLQADAMAIEAKMQVETGNYEKAMDCYEKSFDCDTEKPRYYDALQAVADIRQITGDYKKAAETYDRIINLLKTEWNFTEETVLKDAIKEKERLLKIANKQNTCF